jgi:cytochrome P450/NADPH-cytochrome P450 reductase
LIFLQTHALLDEVCDESRFCKVVVSGLANLRAGVKDGLFTAHDGEYNWGVAHRIIMPVFGPMKIRETLGGMKDVSQELCLKWYVNLSCYISSLL